MWGVGGASWPRPQPGVEEVYSDLSEEDVEGEEEEEEDGDSEL